MNKFKFFTVALLTSVTFGFGQDMDQAKKAIDAEQFEKAKSILKLVIQTKPSNGKAAFLLGNVYLTQSVVDSAKIYFQNGLAGTEGAKFNYIGLGQIELDNGNATAAQTLFTLATKDMRKKDVEENIYIGRAYMNISKPDYKTALTFLNKAKLVNPMDAQIQLALGDAYYGDKNQNEAYAAYRNAFQTDNTLIRAKMQLGVLLKGAKSYDEALKAFNEVIALSPNYGPVYRELAETYYKWGMNKPSKRAEYMTTAIGYYEKYMSLTDYSLNSRMRHADFLILVKDYAALEVEANKMIELDKVNPRIYRYLGYSAYENGNIDVAIKSLESFTSNPSNKIIAKDFLYLGLAKIKKGTSVDGFSIDPTAFNSALMDIKKAIEMESLVVEDLNEIGNNLYTHKLFKEAASVYELGMINSNIKCDNCLNNNLYLGISLYKYFDKFKKDIKPDPIILQKANDALVVVIAKAPLTRDAYFFRARINGLIDNKDLMLENYEEYIKVMSSVDPTELMKTQNKTKIVEAYNTIAANSDKVKAKEYLSKTLELDPTDEFALDSLNKLKK